MLNSLTPGPWAILTASRLCSVRLLAIGKVATSQSVKWSCEPAEVSLTIRRLVEESLGRKSKVQPSHRASHDYSLLERAPGTEETSTIPRREILASLTSFVRETQQSFMTEDPSLHRHLAQIYRELGEQRMRMRQLQLAIEQPSEPNNQPMMASNCGMTVPEEPPNTVLNRDNDEDGDSAAVDIFFDCVSRFSTNNSSSSINRLYANFSGSPDYRFESAPSFYPEQYTIEGLFSEPVFVISMKQSLEDHRTQNYFLLYAETPRRWRRIIVSATFRALRERSAISLVSATDNDEYSCKILPKALQSSLNSLFCRLELLSSVSRLSLSLREDESGQFTIESPRIEVVEDLLEKEMACEDQILQDIEDMGCTTFLEPDISVTSRISSTSYHVMVNNCKYVEQKAPFASAGREGENGFQDFFSDLKLLNSLRGCSGVVQCIGVVLDETRLHLRSYLHESPAIFSLKRVFTVANSNSETIPWSIREVWSRQIVNAVSEIHSKGLVVGVLDFGNIGLRADGTAILVRLRTSHRHLPNELGLMPPEFRNVLKDGDSTQRQTMNFRTDIFQLGYILWLLAEHRSHVTDYLCATSACTTFPRSGCTAKHANPVELPACCGGIPSYFSDVIRECRSPDPRARPTARKLAKALPFTGEFPPSIIELVDAFAPRVNYFCVYCDECGRYTRDLHYHCNVCRLGNFDLCSTCIAQGTHCFNSEHRLVKRIMRNGRLVDGSSN
jgi:hypothetical protein